MKTVMHWLRRANQPMPAMETDHDRAGGRSAHQPPELKQVVNPLVALHGFAGPTWCDGGYSGLAREGYLSNPVVNRCIRMVAEAAGSVSWLVYDGREEMDTHPLLNLLANPNPRQAGPELLENLVSNLLIAGNAWLQRIDHDNEPRELHSLRPDRMEIILDDTGWPIAYEHSLNGNRTRFDIPPLHSPVLHIALHNPLGDFDGASPLASAHMALDIHNAANRWNKALLDNSARPSGALVYAAADAGNLTEEQFSRLKSELEEGYSGASRAGRPMLLEGGLDWKQMGFSPKDMDFMEARNGAARDIALALGVPPMLLGIPGDNTYSNYQEANRAFWRQTVLPIVNRLANSLQNWLGPVWSSDIRLGFDRDAVEALATDREALWTRVNQADFLTVNEKRAATGYGELSASQNPDIARQGADDAL